MSGALGQKSLAIVEPRGSYSRDKTWSFWRTDEHNFGDCVTSRWNSFKVIGPSGQTQVNCEDTPYESVDSGRFYRKVLDRLAGNDAIQFVPSSNHLQLGDALVFNSVPRGGHPERLWQHFRGVELVAPPGTFDSSSVTLMDFVCDNVVRCTFSTCCHFHRAGPWWRPHGSDRSPLAVMTMTAN